MHKKALSLGDNPCTMHCRRIIKGNGYRKLYCLGQLRIVFGAHNTIHKDVAHVLKSITSLLSQIWIGQFFKKDKKQKARPNKHWLDMSTDKNAFQFHLKVSEKQFCSNSLKQLKQYRSQWSEQVSKQIQKWENKKNTIYSNNLLLLLSCPFFIPWRTHTQSKMFW